MKRILLSGLLCVFLALPGVAMSDGHEDNLDVSLYGRLWPKVTYSATDDDSSTDITDALSRLGVSADYKLSDTLTAVLQAEVRVNLGQNDSQDFFTEHLGYVGLRSSDFGLIAIGTQWNPYYNIVAAPTDVYYHRASPFGYDNQGPFREEQIVRYAHSFNGFSLDVGAQLKKTTDGGQETGPEHFDKFYAGVGYTHGPFYLGVGYLRHEEAVPEGMAGEKVRDFIGVGSSLNVTEDLYLAVTYQAIQFENVGVNTDRYSLDVAASYSMGSGYTLTGGVFSYDDDTGESGGSQHMGYNLTLIKALNDNVKVFGEWLGKDYDDAAKSSENALSFGIRIDFSAGII